MHKTGPARLLRVGALQLLTLILLIEPSQAQLDTSFTYQGSLSDMGVEANGAYDFEFELWDQSNGGVQLGATLFVDDLVLSDGVFTVPLDFGTVFDGIDLWLEIHIREGASTGGFQGLLPRTQLTASPQALYSDFAQFSDFANVAGVAGPWVLNGSLAYYNGGNVGIGTSTPDLPLSVTGEIGSIGPSGGTFTARNPNNQSAGISLGWSNDVARLRISGGGAGALGGLDIQRLGNQSLMRLLDNGNVGIGTSSPVHKLHVEGPALASAVYGHTTYNGSDRAGVHGLADAVNFGSGVLGVSSGPSGTGVLGHATNSSGTNFGVAGASSSFSGFDFYAFGIGVNYGAVSSRRWKSNIENIDRPLDKIARLRGVTYDWDADHGGHHDIGMIAEEVGEVLPEIVAFEKNGIDAIGLDYSKLSPLLVESINALRAEKDAEISELKQRVERLERLLGALLEP